jgi:hypothetical protein
MAPILTSSPGLLHLPTELQLRILRFTGLVRCGYPLGLTIEEKGSSRHRSLYKLEEDEKYVFLNSCISPSPYRRKRIPMAILQTCKPMSTEAHNLVYAENVFLLNDDN